MTISDALSVLSILVIDDSEGDRVLYRHALKRSVLGSVKIREAATGAEGVRLTREDPPDCILLDFRLPDLDGLDVLDALRDEDGETLVPVIMLTGQGDENVAAKAIQSGAQDYVVKGVLNHERLALAIVAARARFAYRRKEVAQRKEFRTFAYAAAHDLKAPLRRASAFAGILTAVCSPELSAEANSAVLGITRSLHQMQVMVDGLLAFARCGYGVPASHPVALEDVVRTALTNLSSTFNLDSVSITIGQLPTVPGDEVTLGILFQNLIGNAMKYNRAPRAEVAVDAERQNGMWAIRVHDNGIGIEREHLEEIFIPLKRLHSSQDFEGTGLGLATCRRIAEHHSGRICCESEPGRGTTFTLTLPAGDRKRSAPAKGGPRPAVDGGAG